MKKNKTKNPLIKRVPRELKGDWSKYLLVSLFMIFVIGCIAGMYVANESMLTAATENTKKSICEDGHFELSKKAKKGTFDSLSATIYEDFYYNLNEDKDGDGKKEGTIRVFQKNDEVNLASVLDGKLRKISLSDFFFIATVQYSHSYLLNSYFLSFHISS